MSKVFNFKGEVVNVVVSTKDLSSKFLSPLEDRTRNYYYKAQFDRNNVQEIGLQVYKDYFTSLAFVYTDRDGDSSWCELGNLYNIGTENFYVNLGSYSVKEVSDEVKKLLNNNYEIAYNPELEELNDAIASGDYEWVDSIVGDRDLAKLI